MENCGDVFCYLLSRLQNGCLVSTSLALNWNESFDRRPIPAPFVRIVEVVARDKPFVIGNRFFPTLFETEDDSFVVSANRNSFAIRHFVQKPEPVLSGFRCRYRFHMYNVQSPPHCVNDATPTEERRFFHLCWASSWI